MPPQLLDTVSPDDLNAVLAHELAHIARHDFAKNLLYTLLSLPIAWHPLLWRTRARLAESRELLCDDAAAEAVAGRKQYAQSLLRLASIFAGQPRIATLHAVGILDFRSNANTLERRVMILTRKRIPISTGRRILISLSLLSSLPSPPAPRRSRCIRMYPRSRQMRSNQRRPTSST